MNIANEIKKAFEDAGGQLKDDLWKPEDLDVLSQRAQDLAGLQRKAENTSDPQKRAQYKLAAKLVVQHVELLALTRMHVAEKHIQEALQRFFWNVLLPALIKVVPLLF